jgi:hypothetical protein
MTDVAACYLCGRECLPLVNVTWVRSHWTNWQIRIWRSFGPERRISGYCTDVVVAVTPASVTKRRRPHIVNSGKPQPS